MEEEKNYYPKLRGEGEKDKPLKTMEFVSEYWKDARTYGECVGILDNMLDTITFGDKRYFECLCHRLCYAINKMKQDSIIRLNFDVALLEQSMGRIKVEDFTLFLAELWENDIKLLNEVLRRIGVRLTESCSDNLPTGVLYAFIKEVATNFKEIANEEDQYKALIKQLKHQQAIPTGTGYKCVPSDKVINAFVEKLKQGG